MKCRLCDGTGLNEPTKKLADGWYGDDYQGGWCHHLDQTDVQALIDEGRLWDFTRVITKDGWKDKDPPYVPTAKEVNEWSHKGIGHDALNRWICIKARAERHGFYGKCEYCDVEPPTGDGWQMWETVSEGSPISPVCDSPESLAKWLADNGASAGGARKATYEQWLGMIGEGWAPSMLSTPKTGFVSGVEAITLVK
jgi:hypothetical protein